jgi:branched-chain amino acid transport system substrate-binding protein
MRTSLPSRRPQIRRLALAIPAGLLAATALAACGSDDDASSGAPSSAPPSPTSVLGAENKATGAPIKVGFVYEGTTAAIDTSNQAKSADAVVKYANQYLGGLGGRPVVLVKCETKGNPATAADCGNQFVQAGVIAVSAGSLGQTEPVVKAINAAGIPLIDNMNASTSVVAGTQNLSILNPLNSIGGPAVYAKKQGLKSAAYLVIDVPAAVDPVKTLGSVMFSNAGAPANIVPVAPGTADMTPQVQAAEAKNPAMYQVTGNPSFCTAAFKAIKSLGINKPITTIDRCLDKAGAASINGGYAGLTIFTSANLDPAQQETKLFHQIMDMNGVTVDPDATVAYQAMSAFFRAGDASGDLKDFTPAGLMTAIRAMPPVDIPLGGGGKFQCDGNAISLSKAFCSTQGIVAKADKDGNLSDFQTITDPDVYKFPTK